MWADLAFALSGLRFERAMRRLRRHQPPRAQAAQTNSESIPISRVVRKDSGAVHALVHVCARSKPDVPWAAVGQAASALLLAADACVTSWACIRLGGRARARRGRRSMVRAWRRPHRLGMSQLVAVSSEGKALVHVAQVLV